MTKATMCLLHTPLTSSNSPNRPSSSSLHTPTPETSISNSSELLWLLLDLSQREADAWVCVWGQDGDYVCVWVLKALTSRMPPDKTLKTQENLIRWDFHSKSNTHCRTAVHTFDSTPACDEDDDEDDECQEQEGREDVAQWHQEVVPVVRQNHIDDSRWFSLRGVWVTQRSQQSAFHFLYASFLGYLVVSVYCGCSGGLYLMRWHKHLLIGRDFYRRKWFSFCGRGCEGCLLLHMDKRVCDAMLSLTPFKLFCVLFFSLCDEISQHLKKILNTFAGQGEIISRSA